MQSRRFEDRAARPSLAELYAKLDANKWYLYESGLSGQIVNSFWAGNITLNNTLHAPADSNGDRWVEWYAKWAVRTQYEPVSSLDGFFLKGSPGTEHADGLQANSATMCQKNCSQKWTEPSVERQDWYRILFHFELEPQSAVNAVVELNRFTYQCSYESSLGISGECCVCSPTLFFCEHCSLLCGITACYLWL